MMKAFLNHLGIQFKMDLREKGTLMTYYLVPLIFYLIMGAVFSSVNPASKQTMTAAMAIFAVTMGAVLGMPAPIVRMRESGVLRAYRVCGIPGWAVLLIQALSAFLHLLVVSIIILITAPLFFGAAMPHSYLVFFLNLFILLFASIALGLLIGVSAKSQSVAMMLSQAIFLPTVMLGGIMFPASMLPKVLGVLGHLLPATYAMQAFEALAFGLPAELSVVLCLAVNMGIGAMAAFFSVLKYRAAVRG